MQKNAETQDILIVDDMPANLDLLSSLLKTGGHKIRMAVNGELALRAARNSPPDLILLDISMPGLDGYEVCARFKADEALREIPVIFMSSLNETVDKVKAFRAGGADYVSKPINLEEVRARVETHLKIAAQRRRLNQSYEKLKALEKLRDGLVHMMVHDLRSPLSGIIAFLDFLRKDAAGALPADVAKDIDEALKAANKMIAMVSNMLDANKMEDGKLQLKLADCELGGALESAAAGIRALARGRRLIIEPDGGPVMVKADGELIARVLQNMLSNALKFAPQEGGYVKMAARRTDGGARVTVENNGPAIPPEFQAGIFEKFGQVETGAGKGGYSTGLGLNFCKLAIEAHGGSLGVDSAPGQPTVFWFELKGAEGIA